MENNILAILTGEDREEIKKALKDIIIENIREDFKERGEYLFDMDDISNMMNEAIEEIKTEIRPMLKQYMFEEMKKKLNLDI